jgi:hypothetical protein
MLVLSLILIVVTISIPRLGLLSDFELFREIEYLEGVYHYLQQRAMASNKTHILVFDLKKPGYECVVDNVSIITRVLGKNVKFGFLQGAYGPPANPVKRLDHPINLDLPLNIDLKNENLSTKFLSNGKITAGSIYFIDSHNRRMGALTCSLSHVSYIRRYRYNNFKWVAL